MILKTKMISSLEKVFCDEELNADEFSRGNALRGEVFSFQLAYYSDELNCPLTIELESELKDYITIRSVELVPCEFTGYDFDDNVLRTAPGLYPDPLMPIDNLRNATKQWRSLWIKVAIPPDYTPSSYEIKLKLLLTSKEHKHEQSETFILEVLAPVLPKQKLIHTQWFHADCIFTQYGVECWSEAHWTLLDKYIRNAAEHGINMLLTPLWTPPLDTDVDGERPTVQLLDISKAGDNYSFDFTRLERWIKLCLDAGIEYFEMAHLFTQWGAKCCPKIIVNEHGADKKLFGWHTAAVSAEYRNFLNQLLPALKRFLKNQNIFDKCYFHLSDEPNITNIDSYRAARDIVKGLLSDCKIIDALSKVEFYDQGLIEHPIPANNHLDEFVPRNIKNQWTYYCVSQREKVPNRFFVFPSARNRIMGVLMYKYDIAGFLHWGFNFWYTQYSIDQNMDPFKVTDSGRAFGGGDPFLVYPGPDGPIDSLKYEVHYEALQDLRALRLLESKIGRQATLEMLENGLDTPLTMTEYPRSATWLFNMRSKLNHYIAQAE
ncbi:MAG: DUF4091 domain-containing protein [Victivallaceae bacterium]|nr:DUF4091 domain-containing protein [Victivallaceae bacterium]